jgi:hypothetical protein
VDKPKFESVCPLLFSLKPSPSLYISSTASLSRAVQSLYPSKNIFSVYIVNSMQTAYPLPDKTFKIVYNY